jgi:hypothetical protein
VVAAPSCLVSPGRRERTSAKTCSTTTVTTSSQSSNSYSLSCVATKCFAARLDRAVVVDEGSPPWKGKLTQRARSLPLLSSAPVQTWRSCEGLLVLTSRGPPPTAPPGPSQVHVPTQHDALARQLLRHRGAGVPVICACPCGLVLLGEELCRQLPRAVPHVIAADSTHPSHV